MGKDHSHEPQAPGALALIEGFINTYSVDRRVDEIPSRDVLTDWLVERGLLASDEPVERGDLRRAKALREALRSLCLTNHGEPFEPAAAEALNAQAARSGVAARFDARGDGRLSPETGGVDGALGALVAAVLTAMADGTWARLKVCRSGDCLWAFYDRSRNASRQWCSMDVCGNRNKARTFRARHKA